jgi:hypothetical protein
VDVRARAIVVTATVVLGVVINLVANLVTNHFRWSLMIGLVAATLSLIGAELWLTRPRDTEPIGSAARFATVVGLNPAAGHTTRPATPPSPQRHRVPAGETNLPVSLSVPHRHRQVLLIGIVAVLVGIGALLAVLHQTSSPVTHTSPPVTATISVGDDPGRVAVSPDGRRAYWTKGDDQPRSQYLLTMIDQNYYGVYKTCVA